MKRLLAFLSASILLACATPQPKEQTLVNRAVDAMGGAERLAAINSVVAKGTQKQWEPEQSDTAGGESRIANDTNWQIWQDRAQSAARTAIEPRFVYPAPRTYTLSQIVTPGAAH